MVEWNERETKLWNLALNKSAAKGEIENAMIAIGTSLRARNVTAESLLLGKVQAKSSTSWGTTRMPFGKYKGLMLEDIDLGYLHWVLGWINDSEERSNKFSWLVMAIEHFL